MTPTDPLLIQELRRDEAVRYVIYPDSEGHPTTGVGHNLDASPLPDGWTYPLSDSQVNELLANDLVHDFNALDSHLGWWRTLTYARQRVLANMCFNMGIDGLLEFHHALGCIVAGDYDGAAAAMKASKWADEVGARANRLAAMMRDG